MNLLKAVLVAMFVLNFTSCAHYSKGKCEGKKEKCELKKKDCKDKKKKCDLKKKKACCSKDKKKDA